MFSPAVDPAALDSIERPTRCATADLVVPTLSQPIVTPTIAGESGDDNFLATRRIAIARTSFSANWERVSTDGLSRDRVTALIGDRTNEGASQIQFVNRWVNHAIIYGEDRAVWGRRDYWATADQTLALRRGDCEDLAILKYQMLLALGVDPEAMYLTLARDLARNADHAVLIVRHGDRFFLLDNSTDAILPANLSYDYRPTLSFNGRSAWLHGAVARVRPQVVNAAERAPIPPLPFPALQGYRPVLATIALQEYRPL
jgi:predicted transglutaminase-like cysteine proteinase